MNILIVDDCEEIIKRVKKILQLIPVVKAINYVTTVEAAIPSINNSIDVVFLDVNLPDGNGGVVLKYIKENFAGIKVIMFSNFSDELYKKNFLKKGADYCLDKTAEFETISELLLKIASGK